MEHQKENPHPLMRLPRAGDREIRAKPIRPHPMIREKE